MTGHPGENRWVRVASFDEPGKAYIAAAKLESDDIPCYVDGEYLVGTIWWYANAVGGVKVRVSEAHLQRARESLTRIPYARAYVAEGEATADAEEGPRCPRCDSTDIYREPWIRRVFFMLLLFQQSDLIFLSVWIVLAVWSLLFFAKREWKCEECGHHWLARGFPVITESVRS